MNNPNDRARYVWTDGLMDVAKQVERPPRIDLAEPPCRGCEHWYPHVQVTFGRTGSVRCCNSKEMFFDFSCFIPLGTPTKEW